MVPADVRIVQNMPVLGSGKVDFMAVTKLVRSGGTSPAEAA
jgi:acyl-[acyl-carrier-protein]-phospholipid O-acyltransferase/long-chain-fatty-acid--[acyl-carrier-protein] ligase